MLTAIARLFSPVRRRLETRLRLAIAAGKMAAWEKDLRTGRIWWSAEMFALHGLSQTQGQPQDYYALVHVDDRERVQSQAREAVQSCDTQSIQYRVVWPDGSVHWIEGYGATSCDPAGRPELMIGVCVNIDQRKEEEGELQFLSQASVELAALANYPETMRRIARLAVPHFADWCAVDVLSSEEGVLERVAVAHVDDEKVRLAYELHKRFPPDPHAPGGAWNVIRTGQPELVPVITPEMLESTNPDPEYLQVITSLGLYSYMGVPLNSGGKVRGVISFITSDSRRVFTERNLSHTCDLAARAAVAIRNAELVDALKEADAAKDVFLATLAHELRNPLAPIVNTIGLLARTPDPTRMLPAALEVMQRQTGHLTRLVDDLLDVARINSGKIELQHDLLDLREVLRDAVEASQPLIDSRAHSLSIMLPGEPIGVLGDPVRLVQVFSNLLNNSARYTNAGGRISLTMDADPTSVYVKISDNGIGMDPASLSRVFDLFAQASAEDTQHAHGLGIGLYLVNTLVQMHGGSVLAESPGPGAGSTFTVTLPRAPSESRASPPGDASAAKSSRRVLVVDDNKHAAHSLARLLQVLGHVTATAEDGTQALAMVRQFAPDLVLLDIGLPDISGYEVARRLRASGCGARLIALTGWGQEEDKRRATEAGFDAHWTKPVDLVQLESI